MEKPRPRFDPHATDATPRRRITPDPAEWRYGFRWGIGMVAAGLAVALVLVTLVAAGIQVHPEASRQLTAVYMALLIGGLMVGSASVITRKTRNGQREILLELLDQREVARLRDVALEERLTALEAAIEEHAQALRREIDGRLTALGVAIEKGNQALGQEISDGLAQLRRDVDEANGRCDVLESRAFFADPADVMRLPSGRVTPKMNGSSS